MQGLSLFYSIIIVYKRAALVRRFSLDSAKIALFIFA